MAVYAQSYEPWSGSYTGRLARIWAMVRPGLVQPFRNVWTLIVVLLAFVMVGGWVLILFAVASSQLVEAFAAGNHIYRQEFYSNLLFSMILAVLGATVGSSLVANDLRHRALLMYFSRAITRVDYVAGKFLTLILFLLFVTLGPGLVLYIGQFGIGLERLTAGQRLADLGSLVLHALVLVVPMSAVVLAFSSLTSRAYLAGILWAAFFFSSTGFSEILQATLQEDWTRLLSWTHLTSTLGEHLWQVREIKAGLLSRPPPAPDGHWGAPLLILSSITVFALAVVHRRVRSVEGGE